MEILNDEKRSRYDIVVLYSSLPVSVVGTPSSSGILPSGHSVPAQPLSFHACKYKPM